jgi:hypothetical protein
VYARIMEIVFGPGHVQSAIGRFRTSSIGVITALPGARAFLGSVSRETGRSYTISFWDTDAQRDASASDPGIMENLTGYAPWMAGPFARDSCDVNLLTFVPIDPADPYPPEFVAAASGFAGAHDRDATLARLARRVADPGTAPGFRGACLMTNPTSGRILRLQLWDTHPAAQGAQERMAVDDLELRHAGQLTGAPVYDVQEIAGRWSAV